MATIEENGRFIDTSYDDPQEYYLPALDTTVRTQAKDARAIQYVAQRNYDADSSNYIGYEYLGKSPLPAPEFPTVEAMGRGVIRGVMDVPQTVMSGGNFVLRSAQLAQELQMGTTVPEDSFLMRGQTALQTAIDAIEEAKPQASANSTAGELAESVTENVAFLAGTGGLNALKGLTRLNKFALGKFLKAEAMTAPIYAAAEADEVQKVAMMYGDSSGGVLVKGAAAAFLNTALENASFGMWKRYAANLPVVSRLVNYKILQLVSGEAATEVAQELANWAVQGRTPLDPMHQLYMNALGGALGAGVMAGGQYAANRLAGATQPTEQTPEQGTPTEEPAPAEELPSAGSITGDVGADQIPEEWTTPMTETPTPEPVPNAPVDTAGVPITGKVGEIIQELDGTVNEFTEGITAYLNGDRARFDEIAAKYPEGELEAAINLATDAIDEESRIDNDVAAKNLNDLERKLYEVRNYTAEQIFDSINTSNSTYTDFVHDVFTMPKISNAAIARKAAAYGVPDGLVKHLIITRGVQGYDANHQRALMIQNILQDEKNYPPLSNEELTKVQELGKDTPFELLTRMYFRAMQTPSTFNLEKRAREIGLLEGVLQDADTKKQLLQIAKLEQKLSTLALTRRTDTAQVETMRVEEVAARGQPNAQGVIAQDVRGREYVNRAVPRHSTIMGSFLKLNKDVPYTTYFHELMHAGDVKRLGYGTDIDNYRKNIQSNKQTEHVADTGEYILALGLEAKLSGLFSLANFWTSKDKVATAEYGVRPMTKQLAKRVSDSMDYVIDFIKSASTTRLTSEMVADAVSEATRKVEPVSKMMSQLQTKIEGLTDAEKTSLVYDMREVQLMTEMVQSLMQQQGFITPVESVALDNLSEVKTVPANISNEGQILEIVNNSVNEAASEEVNASNVSRQTANKLTPKDLGLIKPPPNTTMGKMLAWVYKHNAIAGMVDRLYYMGGEKLARMFDISKASRDMGVNIELKKQNMEKAWNETHDVSWNEMLLLLGKKAANGKTYSQNVYMYIVAQDPHSGLEDANEYGQHLTSTMKEFGATLAADVRGQYKRYSAAYQKLRGKELPFEGESYFPIVRDTDGSHYDRIDRIIASLEPSSTKERDDTNAEIIPQDVLEVWNTYSAQVEAVETYYPVLERLRNAFVFSNPIRNYLKTHYGEAYYNALQNDIVQLMSNRQNNIMVKNAIDSAFRNIVTSKIAFSPISAAKNIVNIISWGQAYSNGMTGVWNSMREFTKDRATMNARMKELHDKVPAFHSRMNYGGYMEYVKNVKEAADRGGLFGLGGKIGDTKAAVAVIGALNKMTSLGMSMITNVDGFAIAAGGYDYFKQLEREDAGTAADRFMEWVERQQTSTNMVYRPTWQRAVNNTPFLNLAFAFTNEPAQKWRWIFQSVGEYRAGDITKAQLVHRIGVTGGTALLFAMLSAAPWALLGGDDEVEEYALKRFTDETVGSLTGAFFGGGLIADYISGHIFESGYGAVSIPGVDDVLDTIKEFSDEEYMQILYTGFEAGGAVGASKVGNAISGVFDMLSGDTGKGIHRVMGFSERTAGVLSGESDD